MQLTSSQLHRIIQEEIKELEQEETPPVPEVEEPEVEEPEVEPVKAEPAVEPVVEPAKIKKAPPPSDIPPVEPKPERPKHFHPERTKSPDEGGPKLTAKEWNAAQKQMSYFDANPEDLPDVELKDFDFNKEFDSVVERYKKSYGDHCTTTASGKEYCIAGAHKKAWIKKLTKIFAGSYNDPDTGKKFTSTPEDRAAKYYNEVIYLKMLKNLNNVKLYRSAVNSTKSKVHYIKKFNAAMIKAKEGTEEWDNLSPEKKKELKHLAKLAGHVETGDKKIKKEWDEQFWGDTQRRTGARGMREILAHELGHRISDVPELAKNLYTLSDKLWRANMLTMELPAAAAQFRGKHAPRLGLAYLQNKELSSLLDIDKVAEAREAGELDTSAGYEWESSPGEMYSELMTLRLNLGREIDILDVKNICNGSFKGTDVGKAGFARSPLLRYFNCKNPGKFRDTFNTIAKTDTGAPSQTMAEQKNKFSNKGTNIMKLTKEQLQKTIQEELEAILQEEKRKERRDIEAPLQRIIQEEYETLLREPPALDPLTGQEYEDPYGGVAANIATFGEPSPFEYDPYAAPEGYQIPYDPSTAEPNYRGPGEWSATMEPDWLETVRANQAAQDAANAAATERLLDPGPEGPTPEQVRNELIRQEMERNR